MSILKVKPLIDEYFNLDLSQKSRELDFVLARAVYFKVLRDVYFQSYQSMGRSIGKDHATAMHSYKHFDSYHDYYKSVKECYRHVQIKLGLIEKDPVDLVKDLDIKEHVKECLTYLVQLDDNELKAFIPKIDLYLKSVKYNRKQQQEWKSKQKRA